MRSRIFVPAILLAGCLAAGAAAVTPPKGIPDLSRMALRITDFPGAHVERQGYVKASGPFVASYEREFTPLSVRLGSKRLLGVESDVELARSVADARLFMTAIPLGIALLDPKDLAAAATSGGAAFTYVKLGKIIKLRVGDQAIELTIRFGTKAGEIKALLVFVRVDRTIETLIVAGLPRGALGIPDATRIGRIAAAHAREGLTPMNTAPPTVSGMPQVGQTLTASPGTWSNTPTSFTYSWQRCDAEGANCADTGTSGQTYALTAADEGATVRVAVTAKNPIGSGRAFSAPTTAIVGAPTNTSPPIISGTATVGQTLTVSTGAWTGNPTGFTYQWQRCDAAGAACLDIAGASAATYTVAPDNTGATLRAAVTATNAVGSTTVFSAVTGLVT